jgi:hypothetical protein
MNDVEGRAAVAKLIAHVERTEKDNFNATFANEKSSHIFSAAAEAKDWLRLNPATRV